MKVLNSEGIATHTGPESCVVHREVYGEALTGESVGQPLSRESFKLVQGADAVSVVEGDTDGHALASACTVVRCSRRGRPGIEMATKHHDLVFQFRVSSDFFESAGC